MPTLLSRRIAATLICVGACSLAGIASAAAAPASWAQPQIKLVLKRGLFPGSVSDFRPQDPLTAGVLGDAVSALTGTSQGGVADPAAPVSMEALDAKLVDALGLGDTATRFLLGAQQAGLHPSGWFGTEAVAGLLGLRFNHPSDQDALELQPQQTATRAEAAYSLARIIGFVTDTGATAASPAPAAAGTTSTSTSAATSTSTSTAAAAATTTGSTSATTAAATTGTTTSKTTTSPSTRATDGPRQSSSAAAPLDFASAWQVQSAQAAAAAFTLPALTDWQSRILATAVTYVGYPYVWGGTDQGTPGFDCSGFVWGVYKLTPYPDEGTLADVLQGRTTMAMSGEVPRAKRIAFAQLQPGDVLFFGDGPRSRPAQIDHTGIYLGNGWFVHSADAGVTIDQVAGTYRAAFAWARRPLAEAGLA